MELAQDYTIAIKKGTFCSYDNTYFLQKQVFCSYCFIWFSSEEMDKSSQ